MICRVSNSQVRSILAFSRAGSVPVCAFFPVPGTSTHNFPFPLKRHVKWNLEERRVNCALRALRVWLGMGARMHGVGARVGLGVSYTCLHGYGRARVCRHMGTIQSVPTPEAFSNNEWGVQVSVVINLICSVKTSQIHFLCHKFLCSHVHWGLQRINGCANVCSEVCK